MKILINLFLYISYYDESQVYWSEVVGVHLAEFAALIEAYVINYWEKLHRRIRWKYMS